MKVAYPLTALLLAMGASTVAGCNTMRGVGEDIEATGETVAEAADEAEDDLTDDE